MYSSSRSIFSLFCTSLLSLSTICIWLLIIPQTSQAATIQGSADIQLTAGDKTLSKTNSIEAKPGQNVVIEVFGTGFSGALGAEATFEVSEPTSIINPSGSSAGIFPLTLPSMISDNIVSLTLGGFSPASESGTGLKYLGSLTLTLASDFKSLSITMKKIDFGEAIGSATPNLVFTLVNPASLPKTFDADLNPKSGKQGKSNARINPGRYFPVEIYGGGLKDLTSFEIQVQFDSQAIDASKTKFKTPAPFQITPASSNKPPVPTASLSPRAGVDIHIGSGDGVYSSSNLSAKAQPGGILAIEVYGSGYQGVSGFEAKFHVNNPSAIALLGSTPSTPFPFALSPPTLAGDTITFNLGNLSPATGEDLQLVGTMLITLASDFGGLALTLSNLGFLTAGSRDELTPNAVIIAQSPDGRVGHPISIVEIQDNTLVLKASASKPVSGSILLGTFSFLTQPQFSGSQITFTRVLYTSGESSDTLEPNLSFTLTSVLTDAPVVIQRPVPVTITDKRALIRWVTNKPGTSKILYGTDSKNLSQEATSSGDLIRTHMVLLDNLQIGSRYYFQVTSTDEANRTSEPFPINPAVFFTKKMPDIRPPKILKGPAAFGIATDKANIVLHTDEAAQIKISYGTTKDDLSQNATSTSSQLIQKIPLRTLANGTTYFYTAQLTDLNLNSSTSKVKSFKTLSTQDKRPPRILGRPSALGTTFNGAVIVFKTDEPSSTKILYGTDSTNLSETESVDESVREHRISLGNLLSDTKYFYKVGSTDASENETLSPIFTFKTTANEDSTPPRIVRPPIVPKRSDTQALVVWRTNEPATSTVQFDTTVAIYTDETAGETATASTPAKHHEVALTNLTAGKRYYYKISSTDLAGNDPITRGSSEKMLSFATRVLPDKSAPVVFSRPVALGITQNAAVIKWRADEPHSAVVKFGKLAAGKHTEAELTNTVEDIEFTQDHAITLSDLEAGASYTYEVETSDSDGNTSIISHLSFTTDSKEDTSSPTIVRGPVVRKISASTATIKWLTDEFADSRVSFGLTAAHTDFIEDATGTRIHSITLTNLEPATRYHYSVSSADQSGNTVSTDVSKNIIGLSADHTFRTRVKDDVRPPVILEGPIVEFTNEIVIVKWKTDELSDSRVAVGVGSASNGDVEEGTPIFGEPTELVVEDNDLVIEHSVTVTGLKPGKPYLFQASSTDAAGNTISTNNPKASKFAPPGGFGSFTTSTEADTQFPVITRGPTVVASTSSSLTIEWETDESSNSQVSFGSSQETATKQTTSLNSQEISGTNVTSHRMVLTKLISATTYAYKAASIDASGNGATESQLGFGSTDSDIDLTAPIIQSVNNKTTSSNPDEPIYKNDRSASVQWITNEASDAEVSFGTNADSLLEVRSLPEFTTEHVVTLTNLSPSTTYYYRIASKDQSNNGPVQSAVLTFVTQETPDIQAPTISDVSVAAADSSVSITWQTDELSDSAVQFGTVSGSLGYNIGNATDITTHNVTLTNLLPSTQYFFVVESTDRSANATQISESSFTTLATGEIQTPSAPSDLLVTGGNGAVKLSWTDENPASIGVSGYIVERATADGNFSPIATLEAIKAYIDATVQNNTAYRYQIRAVGLRQLQSPASVSSESVTPNTDNGPGTPSLSIIQGNQLTPTLVIQNSTPLQPNDPLSYTFHIATSADFTDAITVGAGIASGNGTGPTDPQGLTAWTVDRTLTDGTTYHYRIKASDGTFDSSFLIGNFKVDKNTSDFPGDFDGDFLVGFSDFLMFLPTFNKSTGDDNFNAAVDFTGEGTVDFTDFLFFTGTFNRQYIRGPSVSTKPTRMIAYGVDPTTQLKLVAQHTSSEVGAELEINLIMSEAKDLKGFGVRIAFNPSILQFQGITNDGDNLLQTNGRLSELFGTLEHNSEKGELFIVAAVTSGPLVDGHGKVASLRFQLLEERPQNNLMHIAEGLLIDGNLRISTAEHLGAKVSLVPDDFALERNFPNPFNPETTIRYSVPKQGEVTLRIYNILGQEVATLVNSEHLPGYYTAHWGGQDQSGRTVASGIYLYRMQAGKFIRIHKMLLLK